MVRVRFAPSPTGYLHIGGVRTALFNWLWARKNKGAFVLRIEDTDRERSTAESKQVILDSLKWLGIDWDEGPEVGGPNGPYEQTARLDLYRAEAERLIAEKKAFRCFCTKEDLERAREELKARDPKATFRYPGTCRDRTDHPDLPFVVRFRAPTEGTVTYVDKVFGEVKTPNSAQQDFVLLRSDGIPLYNFGAVVDDIAMGITLVARGRDHMVNTPPQILLYEAFGAKVPEFAHLPMMLAPNGEKLSKRHGAVSVTEYRDQGYLPDAVLNYLARFGWSHGDKEVFSKAELVQAFDWNACGRPDGKFDPKKFIAIQQEHMKSKLLSSDDDYARRLVPFLKKEGIDVEPGAISPKAIAVVRPRAKTFVEAAKAIEIFVREPEIAGEARAALDAPEAFTILDGYAAAMTAVGPAEWSRESLEKATKAWAEAASLTPKQFGPAVRVALTGRTASPGLEDVLDALGRERSLSRLEAALGLRKKT